MKAKSALIAALVVASLAGNSFAMMGNGGSGSGNGMMGGGSTGGSNGSGGSASGSGSGMMGSGGMGAAGMVKSVGAGYGMMGAGGLKTGMYAQTMKRAYLDVLAPIASGPDAVTAVQNFLTAAKSSLTISHVWEYQTVYKAELADTTGQLAFDVVADKLTGNVLPEMGLSMMMNASWGRQLQMTPGFGKKLTLTPDDAVTAAMAFVSKNAAVINYNLGTPETYPGYYKFHTTDTSGKPGLDIMVNGYNGGIWMNTQLGAPIGQVQ